MLKNILTVVSPPVKAEAKPSDALSFFFTLDTALSVATPPVIFRSKSAT